MAAGPQLDVESPGLAAGPRVAQRALQFLLGGALADQRRQRGREGDMQRFVTFEQRVRAAWLCRGRRREQHQEKRAEQP